MEYLAQRWHSWVSLTGNCFSHQEGNGTQETLITQGQPISNSTLFKDRVKLGADYGLHLSPVQIHDNDRKFSCHLTVRPGKTLRSSTTVKVFGKSFCILHFLPSSCQCCLPTFLSREEATCLTCSSRARVAIQKVCVPWYLSFMLGVGMRVRSETMMIQLIDWNPTESCKLVSFLVTTPLFTILMFPNNAGNLFNYNCQSETA